MSYVSLTHGALRRLLLQFALIGQPLLVSQLAYAEPRDASALRKIAEAMSGNFTAGQFAQAESLLLGTEKACADRCSAGVKARIWLYVGSVRGNGTGDQARASAAFEQALSLDPSWGPDPKYTNEATLQNYAATRQKLGIGVSPTQTAQLDASTTLAPPPAAAGVAAPVEAATPAPPSAVASSSGNQPATDASQATASVPSNQRINPTPATGAPASLGMFDPNRPMTLDYKPGAPIPEGYRLVGKPRRGLLIGGSITFGVVYGLGIIGASSTDFDDNTAWLLVPVLGPWLAIATRSCAPSDSACEADRDGMDKAMAYLGVGQALGAAIFTLGFIAKKKTLVRKELVSGITIAPIRLGSSGHGLGIAGKF